MTRRPLSIFTTVRCPPGRRGEVADILSELVAASEGDQGTDIYTMHFSRDDSDLLWFFELYHDEDAWRWHAAKPETRDILDRLAAPDGPRPLIEVFFTQPYESGRPSRSDAISRSRPAISRSKRHAD